MQGVAVGVTRFEPVSTGSARGVVSGLAASSLVVLQEWVRNDFKRSWLWLRSYPLFVQHGFLKLVQLTTIVAYSTVISWVARKRILGQLKLEYVLVLVILISH